MENELETQNKEVEIIKTIKLDNVDLDSIKNDMIGNNLMYETPFG
jgi:hypothetical protein